MDDEQPIPLSVGQASIDKFPRKVTKEDRAWFTLEDEERDRRRRPIGFAADWKEDEDG